MDSPSRPSQSNLVFSLNFPQTNPFILSTILHKNLLVMDSPAVSFLVFTSPPIKTTQASFQKATPYQTKHSSTLLQSISKNPSASSNRKKSPYHSLQILSSIPYSRTRHSPPIHFLPNVPFLHLFILSTSSLPPFIKSLPFLNQVPSLDSFLPFNPPPPHPPSTRCPSVSTPCALKHPPESPQASPNTKSNRFPFRSPLLFKECKKVA